MLTIFSTITDPERRGDHWKESIKNLKPEQLGYSLFGKEKNNYV